MRDRRLLACGARGLFAALMLSGPVAGAQSPAPPAPPPHQRFWFSGGVGLGRTTGGLPGDLGLGLAASVSATYQPGIPLLTIRTAGVWGILHGDVLADVGLLAGVGTRGPGSHASIAIGPALSKGTVGLFGSRPVSYSPTLGAAVQVQAFGIALQAFGLGLTGFANVNRHQSFGGIVLSLSFGQLPR